MSQHFKLLFQVNLPVKRLAMRKSIRPLYYLSIYAILPNRPKKVNKFRFKHQDFLSSSLQNSFQKRAKA